jgi:hypothetical protein
MNYIYFSSGDLKELKARVTNYPDISSMASMLGSGTAGGKASGMAGAHPAAAMQATLNPTLGGASAAGAAGPSMGGASGMGGHYKPGNQQGHKLGKPKGPQRQSRFVFTRILD